MESRRYSSLDRLVHGLDQALHTVLGPGPVSGQGQASPATGIAEHELDLSERLLAGRLMRVDHAGEIAAQALYLGQAISARLPGVKEKMEEAAREENNHLRWTEERVRELGTHTSYLAPLWYVGSFTIGALAGAAGDRWSLGFVAETEHQVVAHIDSHLSRLPPADDRSRAILEQMRADESRHATVAMEAGAAELPGPVKQLMTAMSQIMTRTAFWI
ncbi:MAG: 2-polyprenyl-3-methyl-6-methoxy-1,4-benzoquinone monooxygenase [Acidiferrobacterales bacterium]